jgi:hypothetical protein
MKVILCFLVFGVIPVSAHAFTLTITNRAYPGAGAGLQAAIDALADSMEASFNTSIASASNQESFLESVGNANSGSSRSFLAPGVQTSSEKILIGVGGSMALALGSGSDLSSGISTPSNQLPPVGVGAKTGITLMVPARLLKISGPFDVSRLSVGGSFYSMDLSSVIGRGISLKSMQASLGFGYQMYTPKDWTPLVRFNGFRITSGLSYSTFDATYSTPFNLTQTGSGVDLVWNSNVDIGVSSTIVSLSNQVTTGVRVLWIWNLFTGLGVDLNFGSSKLTGGSTGPVTGTQTGGGATVFTGTATVDGASNGTSPNPIQLRYLLGTSLPLGPFELYAQGQVSTASVYGLNFGMNLQF